MRNIHFFSFIPLRARQTLPSWLTKLSIVAALAGTCLACSTIEPPGGIIADKHTSDVLSCPVSVRLSTSSIRSLKLIVYVPLDRKPMKFLQSLGDSDASPLTCDNASERTLQTLKPRDVLNRDPTRIKLA